MDESEEALPQPQEVSRNYVFNLQTFMYDSKPASLVLIRDVTQFHELQEERNKVNMMKILHTTVSLEMIAPINNIRIFAKQLLRTGTFANPAEPLKFYRQIKESSKLLYCRLNDLLDRNFIALGNFVAHAVEFRPNKAVDQICQILGNSLLNHGSVTVQTDYDPRLNSTWVGDLDRIQQVLLNLTNNARKFVPKTGGKIQICTSLLEMAGKRFILVSVTDDGPGFTESALGKLSLQFSKLPAKSSLNPKGSGVGLYTCKLICNSLGGDILVRSDPYEKLTKVSFFIPINPVGEQGATLPPDKLAALKTRAFLDSPQTLNPKGKQRRL